MFRFTLVAIVVAATGSTLARAPAPLTLLLEQRLVQTVRQDGTPREHLVSGFESVLPGAVLTQDLTITNTSRQTQRNVRSVVPVPSGTEFAGGIAATGEVRTEFSHDGGKTFGVAPLTKRVTTTHNGQSVTRDVVVSPTTYTHVRWVISTLTPDETRKLSFRVKVK